MKKERISFLGLSAMAMLLASCGDDSSNTFISDPSDNSSVETIYDLGKCNDKREGEVVFVEKENANYKCVGSDWENIGKPESSSDEKKSSSSDKKGSSSSSKNDSSSSGKSSSSSKGDSSDKSSSSENKSSGNDSHDKSSSSKVSSSSSVPESSSSVQGADETVKTVAISKQVFNGVAEKGPYAAGSTLRLSELDEALDLTGTNFEWEVTGSQGDFTSPKITLSTQYAQLQVSGSYYNENFFKPSTGTLTLRGIVDLKDRESVNINVLTELEYERVMHLVNEEGKTFADAKALAEKEVLAAFSIAGDFDNSEDLTIFENGDGNAALLAVSVLMLAETDDAGLAKRIEKFADSFAETGEWNDDKTKATIEKWQVAATTDGTLDSIRKNIESWGYADVVPAFEKYVEVFGNDVVPASSGNLPSSSSSTEGRGSSSSSVTLATPCKTETEDNCEYGTLADSRDGQTYKTVKIGDQVWMAENLNYDDSVQTPSLKERSWCFDDVPEHCNVTGRLYTWAAAIDSAALANDFSGDIQGICPDGWHLPSSDEWSSLITVAGDKGNAVLALRSSNGWGYANGTDDFGFSMLPSGQKQGSDYFSESAYFWTSSESDEHAWDAYYVYTKDISAGLKTPAQHAISIHPAGYKANAFSIRCVKDAETPKKAPSHLYF